MSEPKREWMIGHQGHTGLLTIDEVAVLIRGGQLREQEMVKRQGLPWRAAREIPELQGFFKGGAPAPRAETKAAPVPEADVPTMKGSSPAAKPATGKFGTRPLGGPRFPRLANLRPRTGATAAPAAAPPAPPQPLKAELEKSAAEDVEEIEEEAERLSKESSASNPAVTAEPPKPEDAKPAEEKPPEEIPAEEKPKTGLRLGRPTARRARPKPEPAPQAPLLTPMTAKYYSPAELVRDAAFAFTPTKLIVALGVPLAFFAVAAFVDSGLCRPSLKLGPYSRDVVHFIRDCVEGVGVLAALLALALITRRQLENAEAPTGELIGHLARCAPGTVAIGAGLGVAYGVMKVVLWILGWIRNMSWVTAMLLKFGKIIPLLVAGAAVAVAVAGAFALLYVAAAVAVEGCTPAGAIKHLRGLWRDQSRRMTLHGLIIALAVFGVVTAMSALVVWTYALPETGPAPDMKDPAKAQEIAAHWRGHWVMTSFYDRALMQALIAFVPLSLFATLGVLSYAALRHPEGAQLTPSGPPADTDPGEAARAPAAPSTPMEATAPSATQPGTPEARADARAATPVAGVSDDREEPPPLPSETK